MFYQLHFYDFRGRFMRISRVIHPSLESAISRRDFALSCQKFLKRENRASRIEIVPLIVSDIL